MPLLGGSITELNLPAGQFLSPEDGTQISWDTLSGEVHLGREGRVTGYDLTWPGLRLAGQASEGASVELGGLRLTGQQRYASQDDLIGTGNNTVGLDRLSLGAVPGGVISLSDFRMVTETVLADPEHYDINTRYDVGGLNLWDGPNLTDVKLQFGLRHLARQPMQDLSRAENDLHQEMLQTAQKDGEVPAAQEQQLAALYSQSVMDILKAEPVLVLDQAGWTGVQMSGQTTFSGLSQAISTVPKAGMEEVMTLLTQHVQLALNVRVKPEGVDTLRQLAGEPIMGDDLVGGGVFRTEGEDLVADFGYTNGQLTLNGEVISGD